MMLLRQGSATTIHIGPVTSADGTTLVTNATLSANLLELYKAGSTAAIDLSGRTWAHISNGMYRLDLTTGDLDTAGPLQIHAHLASSRPTRYEANVLAQASYDAIVAGQAIPADVQKIVGSAGAAVNLGAGAAALQTFTVGNNSTVNTVYTDLSIAVGQFFVGRTVVFTSGALKGQAASITGYNGTVKSLTTSALTSAPSPGDTGIIV